MVYIGLLEKHEKKKPERALVHDTTSFAACCSRGNLDSLDVPHRRRKCRWSTKPRQEALLPSLQAVLVSQPQKS